MCQKNLLRRIFILVNMPKHTVQPQVLGLLRENPMLQKKYLEMQDQTTGFLEPHDLKRWGITPPSDAQVRLMPVTLPWFIPPGVAT